MAFPSSALVKLPLGRLQMTSLLLLINPVKIFPGVYLPELCIIWHCGYPPSWSIFLLRTASQVTILTIQYSFCPSLPWPQFLSNISLKLSLIKIYLQRLGGGGGERQRKKEKREMPTGLISDVTSFLPNQFHSLMPRVISVTQAWKQSPFKYVYWIQSWPSGFNKDFIPSGKWIFPRSPAPWASL